MAMKRMNYFKGEFLNKDDFEEEQNYHISMLREHNENLHKGGIASGLEVPETFKDETDATINIIGEAELLIKQGMAIDDSGRQIVLTDDKWITASEIIPAGTVITGATAFYLIIYYDGVPTDQREDNPGTLEYSRITEEPVITFVDKLQPNDPNNPLTLAEVTLDDKKNITKIDLTCRKYASSRIDSKSITSVELDDGAVTSVKIDNEAVTSAKINNGAVKTEHLNDDIFNNFLTSPDGTIGIQSDIPNKVIKLTSQVATGVVEFSGFTQSVQTISDLVDPMFGPGATSVVLSLDDTQTSNNQVFMGDPEAAGFFGLPDISLGALVDTLTGKFRVGMRVNGAATSPIRVRWWAFKPGIEQGDMVVISVSIAPFNPGLRPGTKQQFEAIVTGTDNKMVEWKVEETDGGTIGNTGLYTAPATPGTYHVIATSLADATKSGMTSVVVTEDISVTISPAVAAIFAGEQQQFTAAATGSANPGVTWSVKGTGSGTIDITGLYTAPATAGIYTVIASSKADATKTATAQVTVKSKVAITISPAAVNIFTGRQLKFKATVTGSDTGVIWSVQEGVEGGTIDGTGLYTAPSGITPIKEPILPPIRLEPVNAAVIPRIGINPFVSPATPVISPLPVTPILPTPILPPPILPPPPISPGIVGTYHVIAASRADPTKTAVAIVTVTKVSVSVSPAQVTMLPGKTQKFTASVLGTPDTGVDWSIQEGSSGGTIDSTGLYTSPSGNIRVIEPVLPHNILEPITSPIIARGIAPITSTVPIRSGISTPIITGTIPISPVTIPVSPGIIPVSPVTIPVSPGTIPISPVTIPVSPGTIPVSPGTIPISPGIIPVIPIIPVSPPGIIGTYHIVATSRADPTKTAAATVTVAQVSISISPENISLLPGGSQQFVPTVSNTDNNAVTWSIDEGITGGTITIPWAQIAVKKAISVGEAWDLGEGWVLTINAIDARATPRQVWLSLSRNGTLVDDQVMVQGQTYQYNNIIGAKIDSIFAGATSDMVQFTGVTTSLTGTALYTAPGAPGTYHLVATSVADGTKTATATVTVTPNVSVSISPPNTIISVYKGVQFNAAVTGTTNTAVMWSVQETGGGSINTSGLYVAPGTAGTYHVKATSIEDNTRVAIATITVKPALTVSINPVSATMNVNQTKQFNAVITGNLTTAGITWRVQEPGGGSINTAGLYVAPGTRGTYHVTATSIEDNTKVAVATVIVNALKAGDKIAAEKIVGEKMAEKTAMEKTKDMDKIAEKAAKEGEIITAIVNPGPMTTLDSSPASPDGRAFILPEERPDIGTITQPK